MDITGTQKSAKEALKKYHVKYVRMNSSIYCANSLLYTMQDSIALRSE